MPAWLTWLAGVALITLESASLNAFGLTRLAIQSSLIAAILLGFRREFIPGAMTLVALLPVAEWFAGGPFGSYSLGLVVVFVICQVIGRQLHQVWGLTHFLVAGVATIVHGLVMAGVAGTFYGGPFFGEVIVWSLPSALVALLVAIWPIQWLMGRADAIYEGTARDAVFH